MNIMLGHCKIPFSSLRQDHLCTSPKQDSPHLQPIHGTGAGKWTPIAMEQGEQTRREASAPNEKPNCSKSCKSRGLWRGCVRHLQVPLARGGAPTLPAASNLTQGAITCKMCSAQKPGKQSCPEPRQWCHCCCSTC